MAIIKTRTHKDYQRKITSTLFSEATISGVSGPSLQALAPGISFHFEPRLGGYVLDGSNNPTSVTELAYGVSASSFSSTYKLSIPTAADSETQTKYLKTSGISGGLDLSYMLFPDNARLRANGANGFTVIQVVKSVSTTTNAGTLGKWSSDISWNILNNAASSTITPSFTIANTSSTVFAITSAIDATDSNIHSIIGRVNPSTVKIELSVDGTDSTPVSYTGTVKPGSDPLSIGSTYGAGGGRDPGSSVYFVAIWDRRLTDAEVLAVRTNYLQRVFNKTTL